MGYRVSWIARTGTSMDELLRASRRKRTGECHEFPDVGFYLLELPKGDLEAWVVLIADGSDYFMDLDESLAQSLSEGGNETMYFVCSDTVMVTDLKCFRDGEIVWSIEYDCEDETKRPAITGDAPAIVNEVLKGLRSQQENDADTDYIYDLTAEVGCRLVGFRHDTDFETDDPALFQVLAG
ncbi:MAG: uncharacterized protein JWP89_1128 [Schlesneria sp.]|nr:uncharacterized protein [Schlesneria sp.]